MFYLTDRYYIQPDFNNGWCNEQQLKSYTGLLTGQVSRSKWPEFDGDTIQAYGQEDRHLASSHVLS